MSEDRIVLEERTLEMFGYTSKDVHPTGLKRVVVQCPICKKARTIEMRTLTKTGKTICFKCWKALPRPKYKEEKLEPTPQKVEEERLCKVCGKVPTKFGICYPCSEKVDRVKNNLWERKKRWQKLVQVK